MPDESARVVIAIALAVLLLAILLVARHVRGRARREGERAEAVNAAEVLAEAPSLAPGSAFLYAVALAAHGTRPMQLLVRNQDDATVGTIGYPNARDSILRTIDCVEGQFECHRMFGMTANKVTLHRRGSDAIRMLFEPAAGLERYLCDGDVRYERKLFGGQMQREWRIESRGETVARLIALGAGFGAGARMLVPLREMPLVDQLFVIAMSNRSQARG